MTRGYTDDDKLDPLFADQPISLPTGRVVLEGEISKIFNGENSFVFVEYNEKEKLSGIAPESRLKLFDLFGKCENFGLPHGGGWIDELPWVIDFLNEMKTLKRNIEHALNNEAMESIKYGKN